MASKFLLCSLAIAILCITGATLPADQSGGAQVSSEFDLDQGTPLMKEYNSAWLLVGQGRTGEAIPLLKGIIEKDKTFYRAYRSLVEAYEKSKALDEAER